MLKSRLYWKVLANFGFLLVILTAMTLLTLDILSKIEKDFTISSRDSHALDALEKVRHYLNDVPQAAMAYGLFGSTQARLTYEKGWKEFDGDVDALIKELGDDSISVRSTKTMRDLYHGWIQNVGDKLFNLHDNAVAEKDLPVELHSILELEDKIQYMANARRILREIYQKKIASQPASIQRAMSMSSSLSYFIGLLNIMLAIFALALGFVLTRSITKPVQQLKEGTQKIVEGKFDPINLHRSDELGDLAEAFNNMATLLGGNYTRLKAYSELVTTLNNIETIDEVASKSLRLLCNHTKASVGALYFLNMELNVLTLAAGYALKRSPNFSKTVRIGEGLPGQCAAEQRILEIKNIHSSPEFTIDTGLIEITPSNLIAVPIVFQDAVLGVLILGSTFQFSDLEKEIINNSVPQLGVAITNAMNHDATRKLSLEISKRNEELNSKNDELEKLYRVKSDFLSSMSHELRTPMNSIIGFSSVLLGANGDPLTSDQRKAIEKVLKNGKHLLELINDILDLSKLESGKMNVNVETNDVPNVLSACLLTVEPLLKAKNLNLVQHVGENLPLLTTDIVKVRQILVNLLSNAVKFTEKGDITIAIEALAGGKMQFSVKDSGIGIEKKNFELVFEEFRQVDSSNTRKYKGTGLGLPISRRLARMLGGDLWVDSEVEKGSTFTLVIPTTFVDTSGEGEPVTAKPEPKIVPQFQQQVAATAGLRPGAQILSIDDDADVIEILRKYLVPEGYSVAGALSGDEGIAMAVKLKPALITLDIQMPNKDGWQVLRELKQNAATKDIPVIIHSIVENRPLALTLGAVEVVTKPTDPNRLLALVKQFCTSSNKTVLIVDDNVDFGAAMKDLLRMDGIEATVAKGGKEALDYLAKDIPAMIFLDLMMPEMDGFEVVRKLQSNETWKRIPVVIISGKELTNAEMAALNAHITDFMKKGDLTQSEISGAVKRILQQKPALA